MNSSNNYGHFWRPNRMSPKSLPKMKAPRISGGGGGGQYPK